MEKMLKAREHAGVEREAMAEALGISVRSIVRYETSGPVPKTAVLLYSVKTAVPADWIDPIRCTPRDLNPEPTDYEVGELAPVVSITSLRPIRVIGMGA